MRAAALEVVGVAGSEDATFAINGHLESAAENDTAFFAIVNQRDTSGVATRFVTLLQDLERAPEQVIADLSKGDRSLADLGQFVGPVKCLARPLGFEREEFGHSHRDAVENALERPDGGFIWLDSISEIVELVTPERLASSRWDSLLRLRTKRSRSPTSMLIVASTVGMLLLRVLRIE